MDVIVGSEIVHESKMYLSGLLSLKELEDWVMQRVEYFFKLPPTDEHELAGVIIGGLAEVSLGHRTEEEFRAMISAQIGSTNTLAVQYPETAVHTRTSSTSSTPIITIVAAGVPTYERIPL